MKQITILKIVSFLLFSTTALAQPNLVLSTGSISTASVNRGDHLKITFRVSNTGNVAAGKSHTKIYVSPALSFTNAILLSEISCEALSAGQQTQDINFIYPLPYNVTVGTNYVLAVVDSRNQVAESDESNGFSFTSNFVVGSPYGRQQNLPYPMIFIHGLNSDNTTWDSSLINFQNYYGWSFGGNMNFCLNQSSTSTNKYLDYKNWTDTTTMRVGDFYTINFDVDRNGNLRTAPAFTDVLSNQSAIVKQGLAVSDAIKYVLQKTGRDKVILVGHSMGGLASREYLQNPYLWQPDGNHHVAKLLTVGTPHGGSNSTDFGFSGVGTGLDEHAEAVRDLRSSYFYSLQPGVYLFGGTEDYPTMKDILIGSFYDVDVNCNGVDADGSTIVGLNQKYLPTNLNYSCVIGTGNILGGDGVVASDKANLKNYYSTYSIDTFISQQPFGSLAVWHTQLPKQTEAIVKGFDESNQYNTAYGIDTGRTYFANFSVQSQDPTSYVYDYDDYKIAVSQNGLLNCKLYNIPTAKCYFNLLDSNQIIVYKDSTNGQGYYEFNKSISKGKYFIEFYTTPEAVSWYYPYAFKLLFTPTLPLTLLDFVATLQENKTQLNWASTNEINTNKFDIERSTNSIEWNTLGSVNSVNLTGTNNYNFIDANPNYGINYYRLKMIDKDGSYTYSQIRTVEVSKPNTPFVIAPNPAKGNTFIYFDKEIKNAEIEVYDITGNLLMTQKIVNTQKINLDISTLTKGIYLIKLLEQNSSNKTAKLVVF